MLLMMGMGEHETSGEVTVGLGVNKNDFGVKVIDDREGEDVTNGEASGEVTVGVGVNKNDFDVKVIDDGECERSR